MTEDNTIQNQKWILKSHPKQKFKASRDAELIKEIINLDRIPQEKVVIKVQAVSVDAFIRVLLDEKSNPTHGSSGIDQPIPAMGYGEIVKGNKKFTKGSMVMGLVYAAKYAVVDSEGLNQHNVLPGATPTTAL